MKIRALLYNNAIYEKHSGQTHCVGFTNGTVIGIAQPVGGEAYQRVVDNCHGRKRDLKFQTVTEPD